MSYSICSDEDGCCSPCTNTDEASAEDEEGDDGEIMSAANGCDYERQSNYREKTKKTVY